MKYVPDRKGTLELAQSEGVGKACLSAANLVMNAAKSLPLKGASQQMIADYRADFVARRANVTMAKSGETRAGAYVMNLGREQEAYIGARNRTLYTAIQAMDGQEVG